MEKRGCKADPPLSPIAHWSSTTKLPLLLEETSRGAKSRTRQNTFPAERVGWKHRIIFIAVVMLVYEPHLSSDNSAKYRGISHLSFHEVLKVRGQFTTEHYKYFGHCPSLVTRCLICFPLCNRSFCFLLEGNYFKSWKVSDADSASLEPGHLGDWAWRGTHCIGSAWAVAAPTESTSKGGTWQEDSMWFLNV